MLPDSTQQLIVKLWDLTRRGVIPWRAGDDGEHQFETEGYVVAIRDDPARVRILRPNGHTVEQTESDALSETSWPTPEHTRFDSAVSALAQQAARVASGEVKAVRAVMSALSSPARSVAPKTETASAATSSNKPIFGAIKSFDIANKGASRPAQDAETPNLDATSGKNVYSPWIA